METLYFDGLEYKEVKSETGRIWLDRNLGAKRVAKSLNDSKSFGNYYTFNKIECPEGYRLPIEEEWKAETLSWISKDGEGAFKSPLKLPMSGYRDYISGEPFGVGLSGSYWSNSVVGFNSSSLSFSSSVAFMFSFYRANGLSVRLIKEKMSK